MYVCMYVCMYVVRSCRSYYSLYSCLPYINSESDWKQDRVGLSELKVGMKMQGRIISIAK